jgi:hypothetical protein
MSDSEFELELRALRPAAPAARLQEAIARDLAPARELVAVQDPVPERAVVLRPASGILDRRQERPLFSWWRNLGWATAGALAVLAFVVLPQSLRKTASSQAQNSAAVFEQVESIPEIVSAEDGAVSYEGEDGPTQLVRYSSIQRQTWANPTTGAQIQVEMPREDIFLVPVSYQ